MDSDRKMLTKEQWETVKKAALNPCSGAELMIDGYHISLYLVPTSPYKSELAVYVDGVIDGKKILEDCEERRRFYRPVVKCILPAKPPKGVGKSQWETERKKRQYTAYYPFWTNFTALRRHLVKNNHNIEIAEKGEI